MTKLEKDLRHELKCAYFDWKDIMSLPKVGDDYKKSETHYYCNLCDLVKRLLPKIDIDKCEHLWHKEWLKDNGID